MSLTLMAAIFIPTLIAVTEPDFKNCSSTHSEVRQCYCDAPDGGPVYCAVTIERTNEYSAMAPLLTSVKKSLESMHTSPFVDYFATLFIHII